VDTSTSTDTSTTPGVFVTSGSFSAVLSATRQMAEFQASFSLQSVAPIVTMMRQAPGDAEWHFDSNPEFSFDVNGLSGGSSAVTGSSGPTGFAGGVPTEFGSSGTMFVPGRRPGLGTHSFAGLGDAQQELSAKITGRTETTGTFNVSTTLRQCHSFGGDSFKCTVTKRNGTGFYQRELSGILLGDTLILWSNNFVSMSNRATSVRSFHRGCDPATGASFEIRFDLDPLTHRVSSELACWSAAGEWVECDDVNTTPTTL